MNRARRYLLDDYLGKQLGRRTIVGPEIEPAPGRRKWGVECVCGRFDYVNVYVLVHAKLVGCRKCRGVKYEAEGPIGRWAIRQLAALHKGRHEVAIVSSDLVDLWEAQEGRCALTGLYLFFASGYDDRTTQTASLDRIDSARGYVLGNIQWVHKDVNFMKNRYPQPYFESICMLVARRVHAEE